MEIGENSAQTRAFCTVTEKHSSPGSIHPPVQIESRLCLNPRRNFPKRPLVALFLSLAGIRNASFDTRKIFLVGDKSSLHLLTGLRGLNPHHSRPKLFATRGEFMAQFLIL